MKKTLNIIFFSIIFIVISIVIFLLLYVKVLNFEPITGFNTVYSPDLNVAIWKEQVGSGMTRKEVRKLLGLPVRVHEPTRCDFYTRSKLKWLSFKEYKVCYDGDEKFFLKLEFQTQEAPLIDG